METFVRQPSDDNLTEQANSCPGAAIKIRSLTSCFNVEIDPGLMKREIYKITMNMELKVMLNHSVLMIHIPGIFKDQPKSCLPPAVLV